MSQAYGGHSGQEGRTQSLVGTHVLVDIVPNNVSLQAQTELFYFH